MVPAQGWRSCRPPVPRLRRWVAALRGLAISVVLAAALIAAGPARAELTGGDAGRASGAELFALHCSGCHINGGNIIRRGKTLKLSALQRQGIEGSEAIAAIAAGGIGQMGGYAAVLGDPGAAAVADYVWQQALAGWPRA